MPLDDIQQWWAVQAPNFERSVAINERLLREMLLRRVRSAFVPFQLLRAVETLAGGTLVVASIHVLSQHPAELWYQLVAGGVALMSAYITLLCVLAWQQSFAMDYSAAVTSLQRTLEQIRRAEYRAFKWSLLLGIVAWLPISLVVLEACTGFPALARVNTTWLFANLLFGVACVVAGQALSHRYVERTDLAPWARRLVDALSGRAVRSATQHLQELARFETND